MRGRKTQEEDKKAVTGSSSKLIWSIEITYLLNLTDPRSVAGNGEQSSS